MVVDCYSSTCLSVCLFVPQLQPLFCSSRNTTQHIPNWASQIAKESINVPIIVVFIDHGISPSHVTKGHNPRRQRVCYAPSFSSPFLFFFFFLSKQNHVFLFILINNWMKNKKLHSSWWLFVFSAKKKKRQPGSYWLFESKYWWIFVSCNIWYRFLFLWNHDMLKSG